MFRLFLQLLLKYTLHLKQTFLHINNTGLSTGYSVAHVILFIVLKTNFFSHSHKPLEALNYVIWSLSYFRAAYEI